MEQRDPFSWADDYSRTQHTRAAQENNDSQRMLLSVFAEEAARQRPYSDLPVDLAKQNNSAKNSMNLMYGKAEAKAGDIPKDSLSFGANIADRLAKDLGISVEAASGVAGNLASETGGFKHLQELKPVVPGSRGGAGWAMWTGPRRRDFEKFTGGDTTSPEANYRYLVHDLQANYPQVLAKLRSTNNPLQAASVIHNEFLMPGVPHLRKSALNSQKIYETFNATKNKQVVGDSEYDRRQQRKAATSGASANQAFGNDIKLTFDKTNGKT